VIVGVIVRVVSVIAIHVNPVGVKLIVGVCPSASKIEEKGKANF
jgi:hypothetical protein